MADQNTISELWAIAGAVGPVDVRLFVLLGEPRHISVSNDSPKLLITDIPIIGVTVQNLGAVPIEIGGSRALQYGQGVRVPPNSQWTPGGVSPIGAAGSDTSVARPLYYDRNPASVVAFYANSLTAPHAATQRFSYQPTTGKKAYLQSVLASAMRDAAPAPAGWMASYLIFNPGGGAGQVISIVEEISATVGVQRLAQFAGLGLMVGADNIVAKTQDASTGGSYTYHLALWAVEFDA